MYAFKNKLVVCIIFLLISYSAPVLGQVELNYNGPYEVGKYAGQASFDFKLEETDTILNGQFTMHSMDLDKLIASKDNSFYFDGNFDNNIPEGKWLLKFGEFSLGDSSEWNNLSYQVKLNGKHHQASGVMYRGKPNGKWLHEVYALKNSKISTTLFKSEISFNKGVPQQSFRIEDLNYIMVGRFLRDGHAHDLWELYSTENPDLNESWYFSDGVLNQVIINNEESTDTLIFFDKSLTNPQLTNLDERYLTILNLRHQITQKEDKEWESGMKTLLDENANYYSKINQVISKLGDSEFMPEFKVKVEYQPLTADEETQLKTIKRLTVKSNTISKSILESTQLNILKLADEEVEFILSVLEIIKEENLAFLKSIVEYNEASVLDYIDREGIFPGLHKPKTEFIANYSTEDSINSKRFIGPNSKNYQSLEVGLKGVAQYAEYTSLSIDSIETMLDTKLKREEREQRLLEIEEMLISEFNQLNELIDSLQLQTESKQVQALNSIKLSAKEELSKYSSKEGLEGKAEAANNLIDCFKQMESLSISIANLPNKWTEIKEAYTDQVWNPFTSTVMDEELKVNITNAYSEVLIPFILKKAKEIECSEIDATNELLSLINVRMMELIEEETSKMERKLRKEKDPLTVLKLFGIETNHGGVE